MSDFVIFHELSGVEENRSTSDNAIFNKMKKLNLQASKKNLVLDSPNQDNITSFMYLIAIVFCKILFSELKKLYAWKEGALN